MRLRKIRIERQGSFGGACSNRTRVRRDAIERILLDSIRTELLVPGRKLR